MKRRYRVEFLAWIYGATFDWVAVRRVVRARSDAEALAKARAVQAAYPGASSLLDVTALVSGRLVDDRVGRLLHAYGA